ncbi:MAG: ribonuclease HIII [Candidatus Izemoplasmatales bacterium]|uniref:Ribonuclease HIII n=1 Tax=Hujiaoplasma nucleasis TaxID=2725268 RepID=A0A7L6N042_9MOLU|nr:ribonuclease HIII [Hujiaoplasma nucleasis]QLY39603.1 ribonuclease HIII [Hujiaoplasma nucleasis]
MKTVLELNDKYIKKLVDYYHPYEGKAPSDHIKHYFKTEYFTISVYNSNKVLFQGEDAEKEYNQWAELTGKTLEIPKPISHTSYMNEYYKKTIIGSDEVGTGDYFGPVVVAAALVGPHNYPFLSQFNIQDSKNISDDVILNIGPDLINTIPHHCLVLNNQKFNELTKQGYNLNKIKAYLHNHAIKKLIQKNNQYDMIIVDQFCSEKNYIQYLQEQDMVRHTTLVEKAESLHQSIAVAAIIARYTFLKEMDKLSDKINIVLPKGAGPQVDAIGKVIYLKHGKDIFTQIAKVNFKNSKKIWD